MSPHPALQDYQWADQSRWSAEHGAFESIIERVLAEDLAAGDVTSRATVPANVIATAEIVAKQDLLLAGIKVAAQTFARVDPSLRVQISTQEGKMLPKGSVVLAVSGRGRSILAAERSALNLLQRACGVATMTRRYVEQAGEGLRVVDTRKTMPGLRALDRYAVRCGGGSNHRNDLGSGILIKENHIRCAGGVQAAVAQAKESAPHGLRVECEVTNLEEGQAAVDAGADVLLLDNMDNETVAQAVQRWRGKVLLEVSGGVTLERIPSLAELGVDIVSVGALTHSVVAADLSLLVKTLP